MGTRLIGCICVCLTAAGLTLADEPAKQKKPTDQPAATQTDKPTEKPTLPQLQTAPEQLQTAPATSDSSNTAGAADASCNGHGKTVDLRDDHIGPGYTFWANLEFLWWWNKDGPLPVPLVVSSTGAVIGGADFSYDDSPGGRLTVGGWLDVPHHLGFEASGFVLARNRVTATLASDAGGSPRIVRPIINALTNTSASYIVSQPGLFAGSATVSSLNRFWGAEANLVRNLISDCDCELDLLLGFRYLDLDENFLIGQTTTVLSGGPGSVLTLSDRFVTRNNVFLGQVGGRASIVRGPLTLDAVCKVGFGPNVEQVRIDGSSRLVGPGIDESAVGGLLALAGTNIGRTRTGWFTIVPEVGAQLGWNVTPGLKLHAGYSFLYLNSVVRPGDQINVNVNPTFVPTSGIFGQPSSPAEPSPVFRKTDYWVHGITAGVMLRY